VAEGAKGDKPNRLEFARRLQAAMIERKLDQTRLAQRAAQHMPTKSFGRDNISKYLKGATVPSPLYMAALSKALSLSPEELMPRTAVRLTTAMEETPRLALRAIDGKTAFLRINQEVPMTVALEILKLLGRD